ncbi:hypothetical protein QM480_08460 [Flectobacillus sp. DC10W]|uniref:Lipoprotein n=1 Tax=Flectobacillus longus TaxID=2984207 RepID=A0ABT6YLC5_9BACT|nr:hypothetical protein [Flectobacillus longus]MDI9864355.1 hypothetical protein [Flectobacillus longus]
MKIFSSAKYLLIGNIILCSCVSTTKFERLQSSKERLTKNLVYTENELGSLREKTYILINKFDEESHKLNELNQKVNYLADAIKLDSLELVKYKLSLQDYEEQLRQCHESNSMLVANFNNKISGLHQQYQKKIRLLNNKIRFTKAMQLQLQQKLLTERQKNAQLSRKANVEIH